MTHLGGHNGQTHLDAAVLDYLIERYQIRSMLDIGCGPGGMIDLANARGVLARGVDGDPGVDRADIFVHDFTTGHFNLERHEPGWFFVDLIWCFEVYEHIEAEYSKHLWNTFALARVLFLTVAPRGFGGHHHVNELDEPEVRTLLAEHGWAVDEGATSWVRANGDHPYSRDRGLVCVRL
jgi:hypothetical protein